MWKVSAEFVGRMISVASALFAGVDVDLEQLEKRLKICAQCDKVILIERLKEADRMRCGICGCCIARDRRLLNLARYRETKRYGCKYPGGSKWRKAGV